MAKRRKVYRDSKGRFISKAKAEAQARRTATAKKSPGRQRKSRVATRLPARKPTRKKVAVRKGRRVADISPVYPVGTEFELTATTPGGTPGKRGRK